MRRLAKRALRWAGYHVQGTRYVPRQLFDESSVRRLEFDDLLCRQMFDVRGQFTFVQVGAFDGVTKDPLFKYIRRCGWRGVMLEPQPDAAARLRELYAGYDDVIVLEAAAGSSTGSRPLYTVNAAGLPDWVGGLASFDRHAVEKHAVLVPGLERRISSAMVKCVAFDEVLDRLGGHRLDLLQIDAEGADLDLLALFPFGRIRPALIHWEIKHATRADRERCFDRLLTIGYRIAPAGPEDMIAVLAQ